VTVNTMEKIGKIIGSEKVPGSFFSVNLIFMRDA
jgi:hypothetical protein